ncbi:hypothetical protein HYS31_03990 [Candidatus Woesearchaeota archaeon]|nr:hypothetical protein [Candidatus Woesearchaeota archaeon]
MKKYYLLFGLIVIIGVIVVIFTIPNNPPIDLTKSEPNILKSELPNDTKVDKVEYNMTEIMQKGLHYDTTLEKVEYNITEVFNRAKIEGYGIRLDGEFINVIFNLSDEKRGYMTIEGAWENSPKHIGINGNRFEVIDFRTDDYWVHILDLYPNQWFVKFVPLKDMQIENAKEIINQEFIKLGIFPEGFKSSIVFGEGYPPPQLA